LGPACARATHPRNAGVYGWRARPQFGTPAVPAASWLARG